MIKRSLFLTIKSIPQLFLYWLLIIYYTNPWKHSRALHIQFPIVPRTLPTYQISILLQYLAYQCRVLIPQGCMWCSFNILLSTVFTFNTHLDIPTSRSPTVIRSYKDYTSAKPLFRPCEYFRLENCSYV